MQANRKRSAGSSHFMEALCQTGGTVPIPKTTDAVWVLSFLIVAFCFTSMSTALSSSTFLLA